MSEEKRPSTIAGRRTMGPARPPPRPGRRYSIFVGVAFLALIFLAVFNQVSNNTSGILGLEDEELAPLAEFAVPLATGPVSGDANIAQDDCESGELPCPPEDRRKPACEVTGRGIVNACQLFERPLVLSFWFTRGGECEAQQDVVSRVAPRYRGRVAFLSINVRDDRDEVAEMARERGWRMPVAHDRDGALANLYRIGGCPHFVYAYPGGLLFEADLGELSAAELSAQVEELLVASRRRAAETR